MGVALDIDRERLAEFCEKWKITEFALFGSVTGDQFGEDSDVDVMVAFEEGSEWSAFDVIHMQWELEELFGREVDLLTRKAVERSENPRRKEAILESSDVVYRS